MNKSTITLTGAILLFLMAAALVWQFIQLEKLRGENAVLEKRAADMDEMVSELDTLRQSHVSPEEIQRLRDNQGELLALRNQVTQLKMQVSEANANAEAARARLAAAEQNAAAPDPAPEPSVETPVTTYTATVNASLPWRNSLITGGWQTSPGKRAFALMDASPNADSSQITVRARIVQMPESLAASLGLNELMVGGNQTSDGGVLTPEQTKVIGGTLRTSEGVSMLGAPTVTATPGQAAQISVTQTHTLPSGGTYTTGPMLDVLPTLSPDGQGVQLGVTVKLNVAQPSANR